MDERLGLHGPYAQEVTVEEKEVEEIEKRVGEKQTEVDSGLGGCSAGGTHAETPSSSFSAAFSPQKPFSAFELRRVCWVSYSGPSVAVGFLWGIHIQFFVGVFCL